MTQPTDVTDIQTWWSEALFPGKELFDLKENGDLMIIGSDHYKERLVATFTPANAITVFTALQDKYAEVSAKIKELESEWVTATDKLKLAGKIERIKEYLLHVNAIGNFEPLFLLIGDWEHTIHTLNEENHKARLSLVEEAESLSDNSNFKETTIAFKDLVEKWKQTANTSKSSNDVLWSRLEQAKNKFYDRKRHHQEEQEKKMMQNLDQKMELVDKAEQLAKSEDWKATTETFRTLMDEWKAIGRAHPDKNEVLWNRFITAKNVFFDRKKEHARAIQEEQDANYLLKLALVESAEQIKDGTDWDLTTQAYAEIMEQWKKIGRVSAEKGDELWNRLNAAKEVFFNAKRSHHTTIRMAQEDNLAQKTAIVKRAESLKSATNWSDATTEMNELMDEWKKIGPVAREHNNKTWEQFLAARKYFFARKDAHREERKQQFEKNKAQRIEQSLNFINTLRAEIKEEEERLIDFRNGLQNITPGKKEQELRQHLQTLISEGEARIKRKQEKLDKLNMEASPSDNTKAENIDTGN